MRLTEALVISLTLSLSVAGIAQESVSHESFVAPRVSVIHLVARPEQYHGKRVEVIGYLHVKFEDSALYLSKDDADHLNGANAVWVRYDPARELHPRGKMAEHTDDAMNYFDGRYVILEGFFNMNETGHRGSFSGGLERVVRVIEVRRWYDGPKELAR